MFIDPMDDRMWGESYGREMCETCKQETEHHFQTVERRGCGCLDTAWVACDVCGEGWDVQYEYCDCYDDEEDDWMYYGPDED
jgi:hypothetical protein